MTESACVWLFRNGRRPDRILSRIKGVPEVKERRIAMDFRMTLCLALLTLLCGCDPALAGLGLPHYAGTKAAVLGLTRACARQLGPLQIRVNAVCPGVIETPMTEAVPDVALKGLVQTTPLGRVGQPEEIASAALFFASDESSFVTGQWMSPNGGLVIC